MRDRVVPKIASYARRIRRDPAGNVYRRRAFLFPAGRKIVQRLSQAGLRPERGSTGSNDYAL